MREFADTCTLGCSILPMRASLTLLLAGFWALTAAAAPTRSALKQAGANVHVFTSRMPVADIQKIVDAVAARQVDNQFGGEGDALLFEPGVYGSKEQPLRIQLGYYTAVAGLGAKPADVR